MLWRKIKNFSGIDFHILLTLLMRLWTVLAGGVMIIGIPHWFTQAEQGYYFTFNSLLGLQVFFELGFNYVVIQLVGHEVAHLNRDEKGNWIGDAKYLDRLTSLIHLLQWWYRIIAVLFFAVVSVAGFIFFQLNGEPNVTGWQVGWPFLVLFSAVNLYLSPFLAVVEGAGQVGHIARLRLIQSMVGYGLLWICLSNSAGLWAVPLVAMSGAIGSVVWLKHYGGFIRQFSARPIADIANKVNWRVEVFPFQWRIAVSWGAGYLIFQLFNPVVFAAQGAEAAGRIGLTLMVFNTLLTVSMSWVNAKAPVLAGCIARGEFDQARAIFRGVAYRSAIANFVGCSALICAVWMVNDVGMQIANRIVSWTDCMLFMLIACANQAIFAMAIFIRAQKKEPMLLSSIVVGILSLGAIYFGAQKSITVMVELYAAVTVVIGLPWAVLIYRRNNLKLS